MIAFIMEPAINSENPLRARQTELINNPRISTGNLTKTVPARDKRIASQYFNIPENPTLYHNLNLLEAADWILYCNQCCEKAYHRLIARYEYLAKEATRRYVRRSLPYRSLLDEDDLYSEAYLGLMDAIRSFYPGMGYSFRSFSHRRIRGAIIDGLRNLQNFPRLIAKIRRELKPLVNQLSQELNRMPTCEELIERYPAVCIDGESLAEVLAHPLVSVNVFNQPLAISNDGEEDYDTSMDLSLFKRAKNRHHQPWDGLQRNDVISKVLQALADDPQEQTVIFSYFFLGKTSPQIAKILNLSLTWVSAKKTSGVQKLKLAARRDPELAENLRHLNPTKD